MENMTSTPADIQRAFDQVVEPYNSACGCMGPQRGEPLCPCAMQTVVRWRGVWVQLTAITPEVPNDYLSSVNVGDVVRSKPFAEEYQVILTDLGPSYIEVLKIVREANGYNIEQTIAFKKVMQTERNSVVRGELSLGEANDLADRIRKAGGHVIVR